MVAEINFGGIRGTMEKVEGHRAANYKRIALPGMGTFSELAGQPWMDLHAHMVQWAANRAIVEPEGLGFRFIIDFSGTKLPDKSVQVHLLDANPASFDNYSLTPASFSAHDPGNVLYHIANRIAEKYKFVVNIAGHSSSNEDFFVFTDGNPSQVVHSLIVAKGPYTCVSAMPSNQWRALGRVISEELKMLSEGTAIEKLGYRLEINNGWFAQAVAQMHAHLKAGNLAAEPII